MAGMRKHRVPNCKCTQPIQRQGVLYSKQLVSLHRGVSKTRRKLLAKATPCFIRYLSSCARGILSGNVKLKKNIYKDLSPHKEFLISLANKRGKIEHKRKLLAKHEGGFWPLLIPLAEAAATAIGSSLFSFGIQKGIEKLTTSASSKK